MHPPPRTTSAAAQDDNARTTSPSPPAVSLSPAPPIASVLASGPLRLVALQEPQNSFHKDEGGKSNFLVFRVVLQGEFTPSLTEALQNNSDATLPLTVTGVLEGGETVDGSVLEIIGGTEQPTGWDEPCLSLRTRTGGVRYRWKTVSKRLGNRSLRVVVGVASMQELDSLSSEYTMVFSKRKNREQRKLEQDREAKEYREKQAAAATLITARADLSPNTMEQNLPAPFVPIIATHTASQPAFYAQKSTIIGSGSRTRPRRLSRETLSSKDEDEDDAYSSGDSYPAARKRARRIGGGGGSGSGPRGTSTTAIPSSTGGGSSTNNTRVIGSIGGGGNSMSGLSMTGQPDRSRIAQLEKEVRDLRAILLDTNKKLESTDKTLDEMRGAMSLMYARGASSGSASTTGGGGGGGGGTGGGGGAAGALLRRNISQNFLWEFGDPNDTSQTSSTVVPSAGAVLVAASMSGPPLMSPQPTRSPFEMDGWVNGNGGANVGSAHPFLRRDISGSGSMFPPSAIPSPQGPRRPFSTSSLI